MKSSTFCGLVATLFLLVPSIVQSGDDPVLRYEHVHTGVADPQGNRIRLEVTVDWQATIVYPRYMKRAGTHRKRLDEEERNQLLHLFSRLDEVSQRQVESEMQGLSRDDAGNIFHVGDVDQVIFESGLEGTGKKRLSIPSPSAWSEVADGAPMLETLADVEVAVRDWMNGVVESIAEEDVEP